MPTRTLNRLRRAAIFLVAVSLQGFAPAHAELTPTSDFTDNGDGTVTHKTTGLTWKRCAEGQTWAGATCAGAGSTYAWADAAKMTGSYAGYNDWRLPSIAELVTIVEHDKVNPAINTAIFPNLGSNGRSGFWSSTPSQAIVDSALAVNFNTQGYTYAAYHGATSPGMPWMTPTPESNFVRLTRGGQPVGSSSFYTPSSDFVDNGDGTVTHKKTNITWKRCVEGFTWTGTTCSGTFSSAEYTWTAAAALTSNYAGYNDWRMPSINELMTIMEWGDRHPSNPAINMGIFPNTPTYIWSASTYAGDTSKAWYVNFSTASDNTSIKSDASARFVRLMRVTRSVAAQPSSSGADCLFNWAEKTYPQFFSPAGASASAPPYYYRYYAGTRNYLATSSSDDKVWVLGAMTGGGLLDVGQVTSLMAVAGCTQ